LLLLLLLLVVVVVKYRTWLLLERDTNTVITCALSRHDTTRQTTNPIAAIAFQRARQRPDTEAAVGCTFLGKTAEKSSIQILVVEATNV
jgi:hypothetical protein